MTANTKKARRIFIDTNVFVGCYREVKADVEAMRKLTKLHDCELYTSVLAVSQTISTLQGRKKNPDERQKIIAFIEKLMHRVNVIGMADTDVSKALHLDTTDIEDNIQFVVGEKVGCYIYITNNTKDFKNYLYNNIRVLSPKKIGSLSVNVYNLK